MIINKLLRGGGKIKDATALPSDVRNGKVFYNNAGRQVGTYDKGVEYIKTFTTPTDGTTPISRRYEYIIYTLSDYNGIQYMQFYNGENSSDLVGKEEYFSYKTIESISINGKTIPKFKCVNMGNVGMEITCGGTNIFFRYSTIYLPNTSKPISIKVTYTK